MNGFTPQENYDFFCVDTQIGLKAATYGQLSEEHITVASDLKGFTDKMIDEVAVSLRNPPMIPDPNNAQNLIRQSPFQISARSIHRLKVAAAAVRYYESIGRSLTPTNMHWNTLENFEIQFMAIKEKQEKDDPDTPKIPKRGGVQRWVEGFKDTLHQIIGVRFSPLSYLIREDVVPGPAPALAPDSPFSAETGSVEDELISRLNHTSPLLKTDNNKLYHLLEEATRNTIYASTISPHSKTMNGRAAYLALISQHAGKDKWEKDITEQEDFLHNRKWKGDTNFTMAAFIKHHRASYNMLEKAADHIEYQLPNERTRVKYLIDNIQCNNPKVEAALANINGDDTPTGKRNNFEAAAAYLLPTCPVATKRRKSGGKTQLLADVSSTAAKGDVKLKKGKGSTGVEFRFHPPKEYKLLNEAQKLELKAWRIENLKGKRKADTIDSDVYSSKKFKSQVSSIVAEALKQHDAAKASDREKDAALRQQLVTFAGSTKKGGSISATSGASVDDCITGIKGILRRTSDQEDGK